MKVAILGGGLSAAYAWRACLDIDIEPDVYADRIFVPPGGYIFAHWLPESVDDRKYWEKISITADGTAEGYGAKMWHARGIKTSFPDKPRTEKGVNPLTAARLLWGSKSRVERKLHVRKLTKDDIRDIIEAFDVVIQTFSFERGEFKTPIWVIPNKASVNEVFYSGDYREFFTRRSQLFNLLSYEFPPVPKTAPSHLAERHRENFEKFPGAKLWYAPEIEPAELNPYHIANDRDGKVLYCGRWGMGWRKFLSHETYQRVIDFIREKENDRAANRFSGESPEVREYASPSVE